MDDQQVYLEKLSAFSRMLRLQGLNVSPQETADACRILIEIGFEDRGTVRQVLRTIYAKSSEEQLIFDRVFDGFFISEEAMRQQAKEQAEREAEMETVRKESMEGLQINGQPMMLSPQQRDAYASRCFISKAYSLCRWGMIKSILGFPTCGRILCSHQTGALTVTHLTKM